MRNVTMRDIGSELGVSAVTVSKALAGKAGVGKELRARIVAKAGELGYVNPSSAARENSSFDIGILVADRFFGGYTFYSHMYKLLVQRLTEAGHYGILEVLAEDSENSLRLPAMVRSSKVDAIVVLGQLDREYLKVLSQGPPPLVFLDFYDDFLQADAVVGDNVYGCKRLTGHLIKLGHRDIGFIGTRKATTSIMDRFLGYYNAMLSSDLPIRAECIINDRDEHGAFIPLALPDRLPTAFVCNCDVIALQLIDQLAETGVRVPEDVSVVGFDDYTINGSHTPALSTFRINQEDMAAAAVKLVVARCNGVPPQNGRVVIGGHPVYRDSVRALNDMKSAAYR